MGGNGDGARSQREMGARGVRGKVWCRTCCIVSVKPLLV